MRPFEIEKQENEKILKNFLETSKTENMKPFVELLQKAKCHCVVTLGERLKEEGFQIHLRSIIGSPRILFSSFEGEPSVTIGRYNECTLNLTKIESIEFAKKERDTCYIVYNGIKGNKLTYKIHTS